MNEEQKYAISQYPDVEAVYRQLNNLIRQPLLEIRPDKLQAYLDYFETSCSRSKELTNEAKQYIPGRRAA